MINLYQEGGIKLVVKNSFTKFMGKQNLCRLKYIYYSFSELIDLLPYKVDFVNIELTSYCNLNCRFCSLDNSKRKSGHLDVSTFKDILKWVLDGREDGIEVREIRLFNGGEPLLHPEFYQILTVIKEMKSVSDFFPKS